MWNPIINIGTGHIKNENRMNNRLKIDRSTKKPYKPLFGLKLNLQMIRELMKCSYKKLFVFGEKDAFTSEIRKYFITHREEYPNSRFVEIKDSGHLFSDKKYEEKVIKKTIEFVCDEVGSNYT